MIRRIAAVIAATAMLLVLAVPVMAGGWADIVADGQTTTPKEGGSVEVGFRVMQHGVTPAPWETRDRALREHEHGNSVRRRRQERRPERPLRRDGDHPARPGSGAGGSPWPTSRAPMSRFA